MNIQEKEREQGILLESGTGEVEYLTFKVGSTKYLINVIKVREILKCPKLTKLPLVTDEIAGIADVRGKVLNIVDLKKILDHEKTNDLEDKYILYCEFNNVQCCFIVETVYNIYRVDWKEVKPCNLGESQVISTVIIEDDIYCVLDFESIIAKLSLSKDMSKIKVAEEIKNEDKKELKVYLADDSAMIRKLLTDTLKNAGYINLVQFGDGQSLLDDITLKIKEEKEVKDFVDIVITDIEMPQMDGYTLIKKLKEDERTKDIPTIIFSSIINEDVRHKGESVGADAQLSKPDVSKLISTIEKLVK